MAQTIKITIQKTSGGVLANWPPAAQIESYPLDIEIVRPSQFQNHDLYITLSDCHVSKRVSLGLQNTYTLNEPFTADKLMFVQPTFIAPPGDNRQTSAAKTALWLEPMPENINPKTPDTLGLLAKNAWAGELETDENGNTVIRNIKGEIIGEVTAGGGGTTIWFADIPARDSYYASNPDKLKSGISCGVGDPVTAYTYDGTQWITGALAFRGPPGAAGQPGNPGVPGDPGANGVPFIIDGTYATYSAAPQTGTAYHFVYITDTGKVHPYDSGGNLQSTGYQFRGDGGGGSGSSTLVVAASASAFPATGNTENLYVAEDTTFLYRWTGSVYAIISDTSTLQSAITTHTGNADIHVTAAQKTSWSGKQAALTTDQLAAANSGVTSAKVTGYDTHIADNDKHVTSSQKTTWDNKQAALTTGQLAAVNSGITATDKNDYDDHLADTANPHEVSLQQAATKQGTSNAVLSGRIFNSSATESNKYLTASEIAALYSGGVRYKGRLKYGAMTTADMDSIEGSADDHDLTIGDVCGVHNNQLSYEWDGSVWVELAHGADVIGDLYKIDYWYGTYDGKSYAGEVQAEIICQAVTPSVIYDLYLDTTILLDGDVTDSKIGDRALLDNAENKSIISIVGKNPTAWLQAIRDRLKWVSRHAATLIEGNAIYGITNPKVGKECNNIFIVDGTYPAGTANEFSFEFRLTDDTIYNLDYVDGVGLTCNGTVLIDDQGVKQMDSFPLPNYCTLISVVGNYQAWDGFINLSYRMTKDLADLDTEKANKIDGIRNGE